MFIDEALNFVYSYASKICDESELANISKELIKIAGKKKYCFESCTEAENYEKTQNLLSKLNEKESIRKNKGVYYTPCDVVKFIVTNSIKASFGKLNKDNIGEESLNSIPYRAFATNKTVFDPTCGTGEYLLAILEMKLRLLDKHYKETPKNIVESVMLTVFGNDINPESVAITKMRLLMCILKRYGAKYCYGMADLIKKNFYTYDYVLTPPKEVKYDIIVGNPPYVEDFKSGLNLNKNYGNIYANVLINAAKQLATNGSMGFIIPLSYVSTPRMKRLRDELIENVREQFILSYADRPDCLFDSVHQKLCILIGKQKKKGRTVYTGNYQYWYKEERDKLFNRTRVVKNRFDMNMCIPKLGTDMDINIFKKITNGKVLKSVYAVSRQGKECVYLNRRESFWMKAYREEINNPEYKVFSFEDEEVADYCYCLINSSLFWWYWISTSDCWHVSKELNGFMAPFDGDYKKASQLSRALRKKLEETKVYVGTKQTKYEYKHKNCIKEIHAIDDYINKRFGLSPEEGKYIKSFAFRYRTGGGVKL